MRKTKVNVITSVCNKDKGPIDNTDYFRM